jgi:HEAT repeat protein
MTRNLKHPCRLRRLVGLLYAGTLLALVSLGPFGGCVTTETTERTVGGVSFPTADPASGAVDSAPARSVYLNKVVPPLQPALEDVPGALAEALEADVTDVADKLADTDPLARELVVTRLGYSDSPHAVPILVLLAMQDPIADVRRAASLALTDLGRELITGPGQARLQGMVGSDEVTVADCLTALLLGTPDEPESRDNIWLERAGGEREMRMVESVPAVRAAVALALAEAGGERTIEALYRLTRRRSEPMFVRSFYMIARARLGDPRAETDALALLQTTDSPELMANALAALSHLGSPRAFDELRKAMAFPDDRVVVAAITGFGELKRFSTLLTLIRSGSPLEQRTAAYVLGVHGGVDYIALLRQIQREIDLSTQDGRRLWTAIAFALAETGYPWAVPDLITVLNSNYPANIRLRAFTRLVRLTNQNFGMDAIDWLRWWITNAGEFVERMNRKLGISVPPIPAD